MEMNIKCVLFIIIQLADLLSKNKGLVTASACSDKRRDCRTLAQYGWCTKRRDTMKHVCGTTCKLCGDQQPQPMTTQTTEHTRKKTCKDYRNDCSNLSKAGWCIKKKSLMAATCKHTCKFCNGPPKTTACEDKRRDCSRFRAFRWCQSESRKQTMFTLCKKTCGFCRGKTRTTTRPTTTTTTKTTTYRRQKPSPTARGCVDLRTDCARLEKLNYCKNPKMRTAMEKLCPSTCNVCPDGPQKTTQAPHEGVCVDNMKGCSFMFTRGWCTKKKSTMMTRCKKTCGFCEACSDKRNDCVRYKKFGWCERKADEMANVCSRTCNLCHKVAPKPPTAAPECYDQRGEAECQKMSRIGFCESRKSAMKTICSKTCKWCSATPTNGPNPNTQPTKATSARKPGCNDKYGRARCEYYSHIGWCDKHAKIKENCRDTCVCNYVKPTTKKPSQNCKDSTLGCCWDNKTVKRSGSKCPDCTDDQRFTVLCARFGGDCEGNGGLAKSLKKYCPKTCKLC